MKTETLQNLLDEHGHLHLFMDSGAEFAVSAGDVRIYDSGRIDIDSETDYFVTDATKVEYVDVEPSTREQEA